MKVLSLQESQAQLTQFNSQRKYGALYSSLYSGIVKSPEAMVIPLDDHMVHRGDGIFEALRFYKSDDGQFIIFDLKGHLDRLFRSADLISLKMNWSFAEISQYCEAVVQHSGLDSGMLRIFVSRGFGDFSPNPYSTQGSHIFVISMGFNPLPKEKYQAGVSIGFSKIPVKPGVFAQVKSCNYLPNVLTKKEAIDNGWDFAINLTENGYVAEGPTENILILNQKNELLAPEFEYSLKGTTLLKVMEEAQKNKNEFGLRCVGHTNLKETDILNAKEVMMVGTTLGVLPVSRVADKSLPVGPLAALLMAKALSPWRPA